MKNELTDEQMDKVNDFVNKSLTKTYIRGLSDEYKEIFIKEPHIENNIVIIDGVERFDDLYKDKDISLTHFITYFLKEIQPKKFRNSDVIRLFYRNLGISISGYYEAFYGVNNLNAKHYKPQDKEKTLEIYNSIISNYNNVVGLEHSPYWVIANNIVYGDLVLNKCININNNKNEKQ